MLTALDLGFFTRLALVWMCLKLSNSYSYSIFFMKDPNLMTLI